MALADFLQPMAQQPLPDMMAPIYKSLAENALNAPQQAPAQQPSGVHRFLNSIGDAFLVANGAPPVHYQRAQQEQVRAALQGFLTAPDQAIAHLMQVDPATAIDLYKSVHPASELPVGVKEYEYEQRLNPDQRAGFEQMLKLTHPGMMAPYVMPEQGGQVITPGGGQESGPAVGQIVGGFRFKGGNPNDKNSWEATSSGSSQTFPGR